MRVPMGLDETTFGIDGWWSQALQMQGAMGVTHNWTCLMY